MCFIYNVQVFFFFHTSHTEFREASNVETPTGTDKKAHGSLLSLVKGQGMGHPQKAENF